MTSRRRHDGLLRGLLAVACAGVLALPTRAAERAVSLTLPAQPLSRTLAELGRQAGVDILAPSATVGDRRAPPLRGRVTPRQALTQLLAGSGLTFEKVEDGVYVVRAAPAAATPEPPTALPELLIVGVRSQNVDQPRDPDDIQPYRVFERSTLRAAQSLSVDDFLQTWLTSNAYSRQSVPTRRNGIPPSRSNFSFRDPNAHANTLVLVDGRRMPAQPLGAQLYQSDVGPIPLPAIGRIETLGSSSGALYGLGAVNGVVNLVLDRDYRGAEVGTTYGAGAHGDGEYGRFDARLGWSTPGDGTAVMVRYGQKRFNGVAIGDRREAYAPLDGATLRAYQGYSRPSGNGVTLFGLNGPFTVGGVSMTQTYIPAGYDGATPLQTVLIQNAGKAAPGLAPAHRDLLLSVESRTEAILANVRQRLWKGAEAYLDYIYLSSRDAYPTASGAFNTQLTADQVARAGISASGPVELVAPIPYVSGSAYSRTITRRVTAGLVFDLPARWRGGVDYAVGDGRSAQVARDYGYDEAAHAAITSGVAPPDGRPAPNPFGDQTRFVADLGRYTTPWAQAEPYLSSRLEDMSLRLSGPVARIRQRDMTLSLTAQQLWESSPYFPNYKHNHLSVRTRSFFAELRAPLEDVLGVPGLELQAAARHQAGRIRFFYGGTMGPVRKSADLYMLGLKAEPVDGLILRGAYASGAQLPDPMMFMSNIGAGLSSLIDPKRNPNQPIMAEGRFRSVWGGSPSLDPDQTRTYSAGVVVNPALLPRTRLSVDYTRIEGHDLLVMIYRGYDFYIQNEDRFPGTVIRDPLTDADRAKGYTAGRIVEVRDMNQNSGASLMQAVDIAAQHDLDLAGGRLSLGAALTWQPTLTMRVPPDNFLSKKTPDGGAPKWRGAAGARWSTADFAASVTVRYIGANLPTYLPARTTVDLSFAWPLPPAPGASETELRVGVRNLLDKYFEDDPLKRRFEMSLIARF